MKQYESIGAVQAPSFIVYRPIQLCIMGDTVGGRNPANQLIGSIPYTPLFNSRWCGIPSINSTFFFPYVHCFSAPQRMISFTSMGIWFHPCSTAHPCKSISKFGYLTSLEFNTPPERWWLEDDLLSFWGDRPVLRGKLWNFRSVMLYYQASKQRT